MSALRLIQPFCSDEYGLPGYFKYETEIDTSDIEAVQGDSVLAEVLVDRTSEDDVLGLHEAFEDATGEDATGNITYELGVSHVSLNDEGRQVVVTKNHTVFVSPPEVEGGEEVLEPYQGEEVRIEDETGRLRRQDSPIVQKAVEAHYLREAGREEDAQALIDEAGELFAQDIAMEQLTGTQAYTIQRHLAAMAIVGKIHEELGIQPDQA